MDSWLPTSSVESTSQMEPAADISEPKPVKSPPGLPSPWRRFTGSFWEAVGWSCGAFFVSTFWAGLMAVLVLLLKDHL